MAVVRAVLTVDKVLNVLELSWATLARGKTELTTPLAN